MGILRTVGAVTLLALCTGCVTTEPGPFTDRSGQVIHREYVPHPMDASKQVELFVAKPDGEGPFPAIIFVHGHQFPDRKGGLVYADVGRLARTVQMGYVAASVSQPGYGNSSGPPDFCGPFSQAAVAEAIQHLRRKPFVEGDKIGLFGYSRGAIVASMVATMDSSLAAVVAAAGMYDLAKGYPTGNKGLDDNIALEAGTSSTAIAERSAINHVADIRPPMLLVHGERDDQFSDDLVVEFADRLKQAGGSAETVIVPEAGHGIPLRPLYEATYGFFERHLR